MVMRFRKWLPKYDRLASQFAAQHFGGWDGVLRLFTYMDRPKLTWDGDEEFPLDVYFVRKMANEYHGLERHAHQYYVTEQYEYAYHHWLMTASWRNENMRISNFTDDRHKAAIELDLRCAFYNEALHDWHWNRFSVRKTLPQAYHFGLRTEILQRKDIKANREIEEAVRKAIARNG